MWNERSSWNVYRVAPKRVRRACLLMLGRGPHPHPVQEEKKQKISKHVRRTWPRPAGLMECAGTRVRRTSPVQETLEAE